MNGISSIVYLCDYQAPYSGNFIASMLRLGKALENRGIRAVFLFPDGARERLWCKKLSESGFGTRFFAKDGSELGALKTLLDTLDEVNASILHVHFGKFALAETAALLRPKLRLILHYHSDFSAGRKPSIARRAKLFFKRIPELLIGRKRLTKITVSETSLAATPDCIPIPNALVTERFSEKHESRESVRARYGIGDGETLVLLFGWSPYVKGVDTAFRAVEALHRRGRTDLVLGIVTGREVNAARMRAFLREKTGCTADEPFLRLFEPTEDVFSYHAASDVFLSASRSETFSYALLEALSVGKPCVSSEIAGVLWAKRFPVVTWFAAGDPDALSRAITDAVCDAADPGFASRADAARRLVSDCYGIETWIDGILAVYDGRFSSVSRR